MTSSASLPPQHVAVRRFGRCALCRFGACRSGADVIRRLLQSQDTELTTLIEELNLCAAGTRACSPHPTIRSLTAIMRTLTAIIRTLTATIHTLTATLRTLSPISKALAVLVRMPALVVRGLTCRQRSPYHACAQICATPHLRQPGFTRSERGAPRHRGLQDDLQVLPRARAQPPGAAPARPH